MCAANYGFTYNFVERYSNVHLQLFYKNNIIPLTHRLLKQLANVFVYLICSFHVWNFASMHLHVCITNYPNNKQTNTTETVELFINLDARYASVGKRYTQYLIIEILY